MQMILIERCIFIYRVQILVRTKAKVRVSPKGWRTVFGRFAECKDKHYSRNLQTFNSLLLSLFDIYAKPEQKQEHCQGISTD